ncbi:metap1d, partial [Symbiodinium sp. KB8]
MKKACLNARDVLAFAGTLVKPGVTTDEIDRKVHFATLSRGIYPSPFNYAHFPKSLCTSVNEVVCHGIPDNRPLEEGDIVSLDVSCFVDGYHGDTY